MRPCHGILLSCKGRCSHLLLGCVCLCVFMPFHLLASTDCKTSVTYLKCSDQRSFVVSIARGFCEVPSPYLKMSYFTSKDENSSQHKLERKRHDILTPSEKIIYIDIGYKSAPN